MDYKLSKNRGALNEIAAAEQTAAPASRSMPMQQNMMMQEASVDYASAHATNVSEMRVAEPPRRRAPPPAVRRGFWVTIEEGQRVLVTTNDGKMELVSGPRRMLRWGRRFNPLVRWVAHPGEFLIVRRKDGEQQHLTGPVNLWEDPREHASVEVEEVLRLDAKEAVVVYSRVADGVNRRIVHGPAAFVPEPGEWLHTFSWHGSRWSHGRYLKVPNALVFQKLWLMPDQMYHDVPDVRTADDAVLTVRLMVFFELVDIGKMLESTHDPIGDFVNAATSDVIDWVGRHEFESFKRHTESLNEIGTYRQLTSRADQCGYAIHKVVYRGYGATDALQRMHDEAIEARTRLMLERATEQQSQELEDTKLVREHARAGRRRGEEAAQVGHEIELSRRRQEAELADAEVRRAFQRSQRERDEASERAAREAAHTAERVHLDGLRALGVELTQLLTQSRADRVIELRGNGVAPHLHVDPEAHRPEPPPRRAR